MSLGSTRDKTEVPTVKPVIVSLIDQAPRPPRPILGVTFKPKLVKIQISSPQQIPDIRIDVPAEPTPSVMPNTPVAGTPGPLDGPIGQVGGPLTLSVIHYVAPIYPSKAAFAGEHGHIALALQVNAEGNVDEAKILRSTGSSRLDKAAVSAVRQWKFAPDQSRTRGEPVWGLVNLDFAPPQRLLGVPLIVMPYAAVAREIDTEVAMNHKRHLHVPSTETSVRSLLQKLIAAFPSERGHDPGMDRESAGDSIEAQLGHLGQIQSVKFLGFVDHGIDRDKSEQLDLRDLTQFERYRYHWEVYDVEQNRGSSVWLVAATTSGSIGRIEVAIR
ncbi:MAG: energy transducer TonB [Steroidobacteraceae bacterium]